MDDSATSVTMIGSGIPLDEPYLQYRLSILANEERKGLRGGKIPINESFYLIGTADPTGTLNSDEVCIILYAFAYTTFVIRIFHIRVGFSDWAGDKRAITYGL